MREGDLIALEELLQSVHERLERLARKMLRNFRSVKAKEQTADVLQKALIRLIRSLPEKELASVREFFGLASMYIRQELIDLARYYGSQRRKALTVNLFPGQARINDSTPIFDPPDCRDDPAELELWTAFHEAVDQLPPEAREIVNLMFYHGWTQVEIAEMFQVSEKWVRRRWREACLRLNTSLGGQMPDLED